MIERFLSSLERRFGRYVPENLTLHFVGAMVVTWLVMLVRPEVASLLTLDAARVKEGEVWRLVTFLALPPDTSPVWLFLALWWTYTLGRDVQSAMGSVRYALYWLVGTVATAAVAFGFGVVASNQFLLMSLFLAFATLFPNFELRLFFMVRVKAKWLALVDAALIVYLALSVTGWQRLMPFVAVGNYFLFFTPTLWAMLRGKARETVRAVESRRQSVPDPVRVRRCTVCGVTDDDRSVEFRVCTCEKCGGKPTEFCLAHARSH